MDFIYGIIAFVFIVYSSITGIACLMQAINKFLNGDR